ncbi:Pyoverdin chromophore biosynthetic protein pvcC [Kibdelosporangium aridum]|uniref:Pyoverdin chromophore biosynthetic protein pvcC n=1 Tax=Kibdelosporangium aridum TaxID=2030 RepID=A0A428Z0H7_KIBAR|nr:4-hydroxyphenylacetate 3-hydroxylase N-terminal domain-containing protein [Kibdelosporangium aridum]RSM77795.1 Pyoverdin chromophore biosynthetic protein pvcC [Kibdelosporangium aridum]
MTAVTDNSYPAENLPHTGESYLESLRDGRSVWIYGEQVKDVTEHPAFRNNARTIAGLYDSLWDPANRDVLTMPTDTGNGGFTHRFFRAPHDVTELKQSRDAIAAWQRQCYGWLGRSPDYKASFMATLGANPGFYDPFAHNAREWYRRAQERVLHINHALVHPPVDRNLPPDQISDVYVHVDQETDAGLVISGAKMVATGSALTHYNFIAHHGVPIKDKKFGVVFMAPMDTPGVKLFCRASYELAAAQVGSPFDYPLSSRMDENDAVIVFDKALIPWENVLVYGDIEKANTFFHKSGFLPRFTLHGVTRLAVKLDFICGLLVKAVEINGTDGFRGVQASVGEVMAYRHLMWALSDAMIQAAVPWGSQFVQPSEEYALTYRVIAPKIYGKVKEIVQQTAGSGLIYLNSGAADWRSDEIRPYLDQYLRGSNGHSAEHRVKVMKLLWDAIGTEFGGRHELYERSYAGNPEQNRIQVLAKGTDAGVTRGMLDLVDRCLSDYDLAGWTTPGLIAPNDMSVSGQHR